MTSGTREGGWSHNKIGFLGLTASLGWAIALVDLNEADCHLATKDCLCYFFLSSLDALFVVSSVFQSLPIVISILKTFLIALN